MYTIGHNLSSFEVQTDLFQFICNWYLIANNFLYNMSNEVLTQITRLLYLTKYKYTHPCSDKSDESWGAYSSMGTFQT